MLGVVAFYSPGKRQKQGARGQAGHVKQKLVNGGVPIIGQKVGCHDKFSKRHRLVFPDAITPNSPAV